MKKTIEIEEPKQQKYLPDHYIDIMLEKYKPANNLRSFLDLQHSECYKTELFSAFLVQNDERKSKQKI